MKNQAKEVRHIILQKASRDGGHVASPLGTVELIQALLAVFDFTKDKITFDVGHQMHAYKILTDRTKTFGTMGKKGGLCFYSNPHESPFDFYIGGHAGTSVSAALGYALGHPEYASIAVIGDGAITGGQPFEALNQAGFLQAKMLVIYNDNDFSTLKNTGFLHAKKRLRKFSQSLGFEYIGVVDGHSTNKLIKVLRRIKSKKNPVFLHVKTKKGKGYRPAEEDPAKFHYLPPFCQKTGKITDETPDIFGNAMVNLACRLKAKHEGLLFVTPAAGRHAGLQKLQQLFPTSVIDTGINEQHCVTFCAGLAMNKNKVICFLPATFLLRAIDQIVDVCMLNAPVVFVLLRPGIANTGPTHQGIYTFGSLNMLPRTRLLNPLNINDFCAMLTSALKFSGPTFIQEPVEDAAYTPSSSSIVEVCKGNALTVIVAGNLLKSAQKLAAKMPGVQVLFLRQIIPLDVARIYDSVQKTKRLLILEDGFANSGIGQHIVAELCKIEPLKFEIMGANYFPQNGTLQEVYKDLQLDDDKIWQAAMRLLK